MSWLLLLCLISSALGEVNYYNVGDYLSKYGYVKYSDRSVTGVHRAIRSFQTHNRLSVTDGNLNEETLALMNSGRCGIPDDPYSYRTGVARWNKFLISWTFLESSMLESEMAAAAFQRWSEVSNFRFVKTNNQNADIVISFKRSNHTNECLDGYCLGEFDGSGGSLGHANFYRAGDKCAEIHLDRDERWYNLIGDPPQDFVSLYKVLLHEIGHALGLVHSDKFYSIMWAFYTNTTDIAFDDVRALVDLYGERATTPRLTTSRATTTTTTRWTTPLRAATTTTTTAASISPSSSPPPNAERNDRDVSPELCEIKPRNFLVTLNNEMYVFYDEWMWTASLSHGTYKMPTKVVESFGVGSFDYIFQRPSGDFVIVTDGYYAIVNTSRINVNFRPLVFNIENSKINAAFLGNYGNAYVIYDQLGLMEFDTTTMKMTHKGIIDERFPGIPHDVSSAFRYIDGNIYFFKYDTYYKFNEFTKQLMAAGPFDLEMFKFLCPKKMLLMQLRNLLKNAHDVDATERYVEEN